MRLPSSIHLAVKLAAAILLAYILLLHVDDLRSNVSKRDSISYWAAARLLARHQNPYDSRVVLALEQQEGYTETKPLVLRTPPWSLVTVLPLAMLSAFWAWAAWVAASLAALVVSMRLCWTMLGDEGRAPTLFWLVGYAFAPVPACLVSGQMGLVLLLGLVLYLRLEPKHPYLAGAALLLPFAKPHLLALFWLVLAIWVISERRWKIAVGFVVALAAASAVALLLDPAIFPHYRAMLQEAAIGNEFIPALSGVLRLLFFRRFFWAQFIPLALAAAWAIFFYWRNRSHWNWRKHGLTLLVVSVLVAPYAWLTDEVVLLPAILQAFLWVYQAWHRLRTSSRILVIGFACLNSLLLLILRAKVPFSTGIYFWSSLVWFGWYFFSRKSSVPHQHSTE